MDMTTTAVALRLEPALTTHQRSMSALSHLIGNWVTGASKTKKNEAQKNNNGYWPLEAKMA